VNIFSVGRFLRKGVTLIGNKASLSFLTWWRERERERWKERRESERESERERNQGNGKRGEKAHWQASVKPEVMKSHAPCAAGAHQLRMARPPRRWHNGPDSVHSQSINTHFHAGPRVETTRLILRLLWETFAKPDVTLRLDAHFPEVTHVDDGLFELDV